MDPTKENIKAVKDGQTKFFSQRQLDNVGVSPNGTYDGWTLTASKPEGIPDSVVTDIAGVVIDDPNAVPAVPLPTEGNPEILTPVKGTVTEPADVKVDDKAEKVVKPSDPNAVPVDPKKVEKVKK